MTESLFFNDCLLVYITKHTKLWLILHCGMFYYVTSLICVTIKIEIFLECNLSEYNVTLLRSNTYLEWNGWNNQQNRFNFRRYNAILVDKMAVRPERKHFPK